MKKAITLLLMLCVLLSCAACTADENASPAFYYLRTNETIQYGQPGALTAPVPCNEPADTSWEEMLGLYLRGPAPEDYFSPIPNGTRLLGLDPREDSLVLTLSPEFSSLDGIQLSLAGACLAATCHSLTGYETVLVHSGENSYTFNLNDFVFLDDSAGN